MIPADSVVRKQIFSSHGNRKEKVQFNNANENKGCY